MATVSVSQLKQGDKLNENVHTQLGGLLLSKGKSITPRDIEILRAFLVSSVSVEKRPEDPFQSTVDNVQDQAHKSSLPFYEKYHDMLLLLRRLFTLAEAGGTLPILEIRTKLEALIGQIDHYNVLTFSPRNLVVGDYLYHNSIQVSLTSYLLAKWHGFVQKDLIPIAMAGLFHDIGNAKVDARILQKPSQLTAAELEEVKKHTIIGYNIIKNVPAINEGVKLTALQHHERVDGSGYPLGLPSEKIHIYAKVVAIADIYHAMSSHRHHKQAASPYLVLEQLLNDSFGKLEPALVQTFIHKVTQFHNGTIVRLSDNSIGEIVFSDRSHPTRPWVNVNGQIVNLSLQRSLHIQEVIKI